MEQKLVNVFKALADTTRLDIVRYLIDKGEWSCGDLSEKFSLSQPTLSHHYKKLFDAGIIQMRKEGVQIFYRIDTEYLNKLGINLKETLK